MWARAACSGFDIGVEAGMGSVLGQGAIGVQYFYWACLLELGRF